MKIALIQMKPQKGDIAANIETHKRFIGLAVQQNADAVFFSELSLTGYEPELAENLAFQLEDKRLDEFQQLSDENEITIGLGLPLKVKAGIYISMAIFQPNRERIVYSKQQLHSDEMPYFIEGKEQIILTIQNKKIAPAICYESLQLSHIENAHQLGAQVYLASVAKAQKGIDKAMVHYPKIAKMYNMPVLMVNCIGFCDNFESVGQSAVWNAKGELVERLGQEKEGILCYNCY